MAAIGAIHEPSRGMHGHLRRAAAPGESFGQGAHRLDLLQPSPAGADSVHGDGGEHLVDHVGVSPGWMHRHVSRARARGEARGIVACRPRKAPDGIEGIDEQAVHAEVRHVGEARPGGEVDRVGMRLLLPGGVDGRTHVLVKGGLRAHAAIGFQRERHHGAAAVVGGQHMPAGRIHRNMARARPHARRVVQLAKAPGRGVDGEGGDRALLAAVGPPGLVGGVEKPPVGMQGEEAWAARGRREPQFLDDARRRVVSIRVNALGARAGVRAHEDHVGVGDDRRRRQRQREAPRRPTTEERVQHASIPRLGSPVGNPEDAPARGCMRQGTCSRLDRSP